MVPPLRRGGDAEADDPEEEGAEGREAAGAKRGLGGLPLWPAVVSFSLPFRFSGLISDYRSVISVVLMVSAAHYCSFPSPKVRKIRILAVALEDTAALCIRFHV